MTAALGAALVLPLVGALACALMGRITAAPGRTVAVVAALSSAALWAVVAAADTAPAIGRIEAGPLAAASTCGLAVLAAARLPRSTLAASTSLCMVTVLAAAAMTGTGVGPDRPLAVGTALLFVLTIVRARAERVRGIVMLALAVGGASTTVGLLLDDVRAGAIAVIAGAGIAAVVAVGTDAALLLVPPTLYATAHTALAGHAAQGGGAVDAVGISGVATALVATLLIHLAARAHNRTSDRSRALAVSAVLIAVVLVAQDSPSLSAAGILVAAGAVLAAASAHPAAMVACLPGAAAAVDGFGTTTGAGHAAAGATAVFVLGAALVPAGGSPDRPPIRADWRLAVAGAFAVIPVWGWTGVGAADYTAAVTVAGATGLVVAVGIALWAFLPPGLRRAPDSLQGRPPAMSHASTNPQATEAGQEAGPVDVRRQVDQAAPAAGPEGIDAPSAEAAQRAVAGPSRVVPAGPAGHRRRGGRRLRAGPGRPPG